MRRVPAWAAAVFAAALLARLAFLFLADQPLLYSHQYHYFTNALRIAEHPEPLRYILTSEEWRTWNQHWTIAPLYHVFAGAVFLLFGPHLLPLRIVQAVLDSLAAVGVGALGRQAAGPRGSWAGIAYAAYWPAIEMPTWTMTENVHTVLLVGGVVLLARLPAARATQGARARGKWREALPGLVLGLGSLARSVTTGFLALAALWRLARTRSLLPAALVAAGGAAVILPWTARNALVGDPVLIETTAFENIWFANHFEPERFGRQQQAVHHQPTPAAKRAAALHFAWRGLKRHPDRFLHKVRINFWHFLRPEGLHNFLRVERSQERWRHLGSLLLDDPLLLAMLPPLVVFLAAGRRGPARELIGLWMAYYLLMVVVVFHNEIRYRSAFVPFGFAGAAGGVAVLAGGGGGRRKWIALAAGLALAGAVLWPFVGPAWALVRARPDTRAAAEAAASGDVAGAWSATERAAARQPGSARPWMDLGRALAAAGHPQPALEAYARGTEQATSGNWRALVARPRLLREAGAAAEAEAALRSVHGLSWEADPWLMLEAGWSELGAPRTDVLDVGGNDYGAVRGFFHPRGDASIGAHRLEWNHYDAPGSPRPPPGLHRWSRGRAWLRLFPTQPAPAYEVRLTLGSPFPSPLPAPEVLVRASGAPPQRFTLGRETAVYTLRAAPPPGQPVVVEIDSPTWTRIGEPAGQGVRVDRMEVRPLAQPAGPEEEAR